MVSVLPCACVVLIAAGGTERPETYAGPLRELRGAVCTQDLLQVGFVCRVFVSCVSLAWLGVSCTVLPCPVLSLCPVLSCPVQSRPVRPCALYFSRISNVFCGAFVMVSLTSLCWLGVTCIPGIRFCLALFVFAFSCCVRGYQIRLFMRWIFVLFRVC